MISVGSTPLVSDLHPWVYGAVLQKPKKEIFSGHLPGFFTLYPPLKVPSLVAAILRNKQLRAYRNTLPGS